MEYDVTIGIPVYNVEGYVAKSLESALNQETSCQIEILLVDDRGIDHSMKVIEEIISKNPRGNIVKIIQHDHNMGLSEARNTIIKNALGKYIIFLDADDYLSLDAIELQYSAAKQYDTDVVMGSVRDIDITKDVDNPLITYVNVPDKHFFGKDKFAMFVCEDIHYHIYSTSWNILFKTEFLRTNGLTFVTRRCEDILFCSDYYPLVERAVLLSNVTYNYMLRPGSILSRQGREKIDPKEIMVQLGNDDYLTEGCNKLRGKPYYEVHCSKVVRYKFSTVCAYLKHRSQIDGNIAFKLLRNNMKHPSKLHEILRYKRYRLFNLLFYVIGVMPPLLSVCVVYLLGKFRKYI